MRVAFALIAALVMALAVLDFLAPEPATRATSSLSALTAEPTDATGGKALFLAECARCHGTDLKGTHQGPPLLHPYYRPDHHADLAFFMAIANGVRQHHWHFGDMPPVPTISREQAGSIVAYIRQMQREAGLVATR